MVSIAHGFPNLIKMTEEVKVKRKPSRSPLPEK
jgi:hypothetical protein